MPNPITVERDGVTWQLRDPAHVAAFLACGWKIAEEKPAVAKKTRKSKE